MNSIWLKGARLEALILVLFLVVISPYRDPKVNWYGESRWVSAHNIVTAIGLVHRGIFPCFSLGVQKELERRVMFEPENIFGADLRRIFPAENFPHRPYEIFWYMGSDAGPSYAARSLWKSTDRYTLGVLVAALAFLHMTSILCLFALLTRLKIPGFALASALTFAYSPMMVGSVYGLSPYVAVPVFLAMALSLAWFGFECLAKETRLARGAGFLLLALSGISITAGGLLRSTVFYGVLPLVVLFAAGIFKSSRRVSHGIGAAICLLAVFSTAHLFEARVWTAEALEMAQQKRHGLWHTVWTGLGEFENPYGFLWDDLGAHEFAKAKDPQMNFASDAYLKILKQHVFETVSSHPMWFLKTLVRRAGNVAANWLQFIPGGRYQPQFVSFILFFFAAGVGSFCCIKRRDWAAMGIMSFFSFFLVIPIFIVSCQDFYNFPGYFGLCLFFFYGLFATRTAIVQKMQKS